MIFNRLTGLDLGKPPPAISLRTIFDRADAPVRYPFLWNAARRTTRNGRALRTMAPISWRCRATSAKSWASSASSSPRSVLRLLGFNYLNNSSINFDGLTKLEGLMKEIGPPHWPWPVDRGARRKGQGHLRAPGGGGRLRRLPWRQTGPRAVSKSADLGDTDSRCRNRFAGICRLGAESAFGRS